MSDWPEVPKPARVTALALSPKPWAIACKRGRVEGGWGARHPGGLNARSSVSLGLGTGEPKESAADLLLDPTLTQGTRCRT